MNVKKTCSRSVRPLLFFFIAVLISATGARAQGHPNFSPPPYKDSARFMKIYPSQTRSIAHITLETGAEYPGRPTDSCWLFKIIEGKMSAYTSLGESENDLVDGVDYYLQYIQVEDGPLIPIQDPKALELFGDNEKASAFFAKKEFARAIKKYNKTGG